LKFPNGVSMEDEERRGCKTFLGSMSNLSNKKSGWEHHLKGASAAGGGATTGLDWNSECGGRVDAGWEGTLFSSQLREVPSIKGDTEEEIWEEEGVVKNPGRRMGHKPTHSPKRKGKLVRGRALNWGGK